MDRATAGQPINRELLNKTKSGAFAPAGAVVQVTAVSRDENGDMTGSRLVNVSCRQLDEDRLNGMVDALVALCDAHLKVGLRVVSRV